MRKTVKHLLAETEGWDDVPKDVADAFVGCCDVKLSVEASVDAKPEKVYNAGGTAKLRAIAVGRMDNDVFAPDPWQPSVKGLPKEGGISYKDFAPEQWEKAVKQLDGLAELLESEDVEVYRPPLVSMEQAMSEPIGLTQTYVRESFSVVGDTVIINQARSPYRRKESRAWEPFFESFQGLNIVRLPPVSDDVADSLPDDPLPYFEGGDFYHLGKDVIITMSGLASSPTGFRFVAEALEAKGFNVWPAYLKSKWEHGDYVFMPIREGLCVACRRGFVDDLLPSPVTDWDCIEITEDEADPGMCCNGIVLRENVVVLQQGTTNRVARALERKGVDVITIPFDGVAFFQGSIDCSTSGLWRE